MSERRDFGFWLLLLLVLLLVAGLFWTPHDPMAQVFISDRLAGSSFENLMGVDGLGRDFLSRVWRGGGNTFLMGISAMVAAVSGAVLLLVLERSGPSILRRQVRRGAGGWLAMPGVFGGLLRVVFLVPWRGGRGGG